MFGKLQSIKEYLPNFHLDYFDLTNKSENERWNNRITLDGSWGEGNIYNFFFTVINELYKTINTPFKLANDIYTRVEETAVHIALREALVNTIVHADYKGDASLKIIKNIYNYEFFNPGLLRISKEEIFKGGNSYPRNTTLMDMFQYIQIGERAGSGFPKIIFAAKENNWKLPEISENHHLNFIKLIFWCVEDIDTMSSEEKAIYSILNLNGTITSREVQEKLSISKNKAIILINKMIEKNLILKVGKGKNTHYTLCFK